jgi:Arc/MetJ family transcription regulator
MCRYIPFEMPTNLKLDDELISETVKLGQFRSKQEAVNTPLREYGHRRKRLGILKLGGQIDFDPDWDCKKMRQKRV